jgi:hypothetical protein
MYSVSKMKYISMAGGNVVAAISSISETINNESYLASKYSKIGGAKKKMA